MTKIPDPNKEIKLIPQTEQLNQTNKPNKQTKQTNHLKHQVGEHKFKTTSQTSLHASIACKGSIAN
jgi:hypothetical protein